MRKLVVFRELEWGCGAEGADEIVGLELGEDSE